MKRMDAGELKGYRRLHQMKLVCLAVWAMGLAMGLGGGVAGLRAADAAALKANAVAVSAAMNLLATLDADSRRRAVFDFGDEEQRGRWSNLPTGLYRRAGLRMGDLKEHQVKATEAVLDAILSKAGREKVAGIIAGDDKLDPGEGGRRLVFGKDEYYLAFLGEPSESKPWGFQCGGHHLAINITWVGDRATAAPSHTGAQPARFEINGKLVRPLGREADLAHALVNDLAPAVRAKAIVRAEFHDLILGPGTEMRAIFPEGVSVSEFGEKQRGMLLELAGNWVGLLPEAAASAKMAELNKTLSETWFAWSGPTKAGSPAYFRIHGPAVFIEYAPQRMGGDPTQHVHTIYRDPSNEYGRKWLGR